MDSYEGFTFFLKSNLLSNTFRSRGWKRFCGHNMVDDLMIPAHCGKEGVIERRPSSISHKISVGSASKPRTEKSGGKWLSMVEIRRKSRPEEEENPTPRAHFLMY